MNEDRPIPSLSELMTWLQNRVSALVERKPAEVPCDEDFHALGLDSVGYLNLAISIEEEWDVPISAMEIFLHSNVELLAEFLISAWPQMKNRTRQLPKGAAECTLVNEGADLAPLFWLNGYEFLELFAPHIPAERPVYYLHHQGTDGRPARHRTIDAMTEYYLEMILHVEPDGPYCIGGYSIGGTLAYELANRLTAMGKNVELLMLLSPAGDPRWLRESLLRSQPMQPVSRGPLQRMLSLARKRLGRYSRRVSNKVLRVKERVQCYRYFLTRRPLPSRLIWTHMQPIYARALKQYTLSRYPGDTIIVYESMRSVQEWIESVDGTCRVLSPVPIKHMDFLEEAYAHLWLEEFVSPLCTGSGLAVGVGEQDEVEAMPGTGEVVSGGLGTG
jgi:thioesterase domain-containing protein/acyl carrier protein